MKKNVPHLSTGHVSIMRRNKIQYNSYKPQVGLDLYRFMESFAQPAGGRSDTIVVPANILERWLTKFSEKFRRDPDFLTRDKDKI